MGIKHHIIKCMAIFCLCAATIVFTRSAIIASGFQKNQGLSCAEIYNTIDKERVTKKQVRLGEVLKIHFKGMEGFTIRKGKVYPAMSVEVLSANGQHVLSLDNAFNDLSDTGIPQAFGNTLSADIGVDDPMEDGESYTARFKIWDAIGTGFMFYETEFSVHGRKPKQEHVAAQDIVSSGLTIENMVFAKDNKPSQFGVFEIGDKVQAVLLDVKGFKQGEDRLHSFDLDVEVIGPSGEIVLKQEALLGEHGHIYLEDATAGSPYVLLDTTNYVPGKYNVSMRVYDKITGKAATAQKSFALFDLKNKS
jgi:hypothetical protein